MDKEKICLMFFCHPTVRSDKKMIKTKWKSHPPFALSPSTLLRINSASSEHFKININISSLPFALSGAPFRCEVEWVLQNLFVIRSHLGEGLLIIFSILLKKDKTRSTACQGHFAQGER
jgi:hypothetical protein